MNFNVVGQCKAEPRAEFQMARAIVRLLATLDGSQTGAPDRLFRR